jgi:uncharacterized protein YneF (UPF0154 family)
MGLFKLLIKIIFFPFFLLRGLFSSRRYREYLRQRSTIDKQLDRLHSLKRKAKREKNVDPAKLKMIDERKNYLNLAKRELRKTYLKQKRLTRRPTSMWAFQSEKRSEKRLRQVMGKLK